MPLSDVTTVLRHYFGYDSLYPPYQEEIIRALADGRMYWE